MINLGFLILFVGKGEFDKLGFVGILYFKRCKLCPCVNCKLCGCIIQNTTIFCSINNSNLYIVLWLTGVGANIVRPLKSVIPMGFCPAYRL